MSYYVYNVNRLPLCLRLGKHMETGAVDIGIDCTAWLEDHPGMTIVGYHIPPGGTADSNYPVYAERVGNVLVWHVNREDTQTVGTGTLEVIGTAEGVEDVSASCKTVILPRATSVSGEIPEAGSGWAINAVSQTAANATAAQEAQTAAEAAASRYPIIGDNGNWLLWDWEQGAYVDSGVAAQGPKGEDGTGGGSCVEATDEEVLVALLEADALPALAVDGSLLAVDDNILIV